MHSIDVINSIIMPASMYIKVTHLHNYVIYTMNTLHISQLIMPQHILFLEACPQLRLSASFSKISTIYITAIVLTQP